MNTPTKITVVRLILTAVILLLLWDAFFSLIGFNFPKYNVNGVLVQLNYIIAGVIFIIASLTDFLDGYLARKNNQVTDLGKMLDAIADKVLVNSVLIILAAKNEINAIIPVIIVVRDIIVNAIKMEAAGRGKVVAAIGSGKIKTASLMVGVVLIFFGNLPFELIPLNVAEFFLYFATVMSIVSMIQYYNINKKLIIDENSK